MKQVKAELFVNEDALKTAFAEGNNDEYSVELAFSCEMNWAKCSGIALDSFEIKDEKISALFSVDEDTLHENFTECNSDDAYSFETAFKSEMNWVHASGITLGDFEVMEDDAVRFGLPYGSTDESVCQQLYGEVTEENLQKLREKREAYFRENEAKCSQE